MQRLSIGLFTDDFFPHLGGTEMVVKNLAIALSAKAEVRVVTQSYNAPGGDFPFPVHRCRSHNYDAFAASALPGLDGKFRREVETQRFDLIHVHTPLAIGRFGIGLAKARGIPVVATFHTQFRYDVMKYLKWAWLADRIVKGIVDKSYQRCDEVWTMHEGLGKILQGYGFGRPEALNYMPNACDYAKPESAAALKALSGAGGERLGLPAGRPVLMAVGRLIEAKNYAFTLRALKRAKEAGLAFTYVMVGEGPYHHELEKLIAELGLGDSAVLYGQVRDRAELAELYARSDLFVLPSLFDCSSLSMIEAAAFSTPTLTLREAMTSHAVRDGVNGYLCAYDEAAFTARILEILGDPAGLAKVGQGARDQLHSTWDQLADRFLDRYRLLIDRKAASAKA